MDNNIPITDQWKLDGNCIKCRRSSYCRKDCGARRRHIAMIKSQALMDALEERYSEQLDN